MKSVEAKKFYVICCPSCDDVIYLRKKDFLLLNNERICFYTCDSCGEKVKVMKGE